MPRILHIGVGNFHRAHQAAYTALSAKDWRITGVVMGNVAMYNAMADGRGYDLGIRSSSGMATHRIAVHDRMIFAQREPRSVIKEFLDPDLHVITLTITEKGYCLDPSTGLLDLENPAILRDFAGDPTSALGLLTHGLARRFKAGLAPLTVISCDNLSGNGRKLKGAVSAFAQKAALELDRGTCFPETMVDRITPATPDAVAPVITEEFTEWVIEDAFASLRPDWNIAGAEFTLDVAPYEMRKLRLLNAAHSWLAYAGQMAGFTYVHEAMADPSLRASVDRLWDEAVLTLPEVVLSTTPAYRAALVNRFSVAEMRHALAQIGADGSLKLRERIVPLINENPSTPQAVEAVAAWIAFVLHKNNEGEVLVDPNAALITQIICDGVDLDETCAGLADLIGVSELTEDWAKTCASLVSGYLGRKYDETT